MPYSLKVNGDEHFLDVDGDTPLLWALRDTLRMTGTKYGCGIGMCGACTVHINGVPTRSCLVPIATVRGEVRTIEGVEGREARAVQAAWIARDVPQCGYCQSGQIMAAIALLQTKSKPSDSDIDSAMTNICRCGTYARIRAAIHEAATSLEK